MLIIKRILNNNIVISENSDGEEIIVMGSGLGFHKNIYDVIPEQGIEKIFINSNSDNSVDLASIITNTDADIIELTKEIVYYAEEHYAITFTPKMFFTLVDHLSYAVERLKDGVNLPNLMLPDIKFFYPTEYAIGLDSIAVIKKRFNLVATEDEAGFIALNILNSSNKLIDKFSEMTEITNEILLIISRDLKIVFDEKSISFIRLNTHLKYFIQRLISLEKNISDDISLFELVKERYPTPFNCSIKIKKFLESRYKIKIHNTELIYLVLHIQRVYEEQT